MTPKFPINQLQYKPGPAEEDADIDGRTLAQYDPMVWLGVSMMILGFALLLVITLLFYLGGWF